MMRLPLSMMLGASAVVLSAGCAQTGSTPAASAARVEAVYRAGQPAGSALGQYAMGREALASGRLQEAVRRFGQALELDPSMVEARNGLGVALGQLGRHEEAVQAFEKVLVARPEAAHVLSNLGFSQLRAGRMDDARLSLRRALELEPGNRVARENLALLPEPVTPGEPRRVPAVPTAAVPQRSTPASEAERAPVVSSLVRVSPNVFELRTAQSAEVASPPGKTASVADARVRPQPPLRIEPAAAPRTDSAATGIIQEHGRIEVSNGVGLPGLAARTARRLRALGVSIERVSDYRSFDRRQTEIHYLPGHQDRASAIRSSLPLDTPLLEVDRLRPGVEVRVVVGRDMTVESVAAWFTGVESQASAVPAASTGAHAGLAAVTPEAAPAGETIAPAAPASPAPMLELASIEVEYGWRQL